MNKKFKIQLRNQKFKAYTLGLLCSVAFASGLITQYTISFIAGFFFLILYCMQCVFIKITYLEVKL